jgi:alkylation response protein AidB-like acyl-CoA dehydrogenase
VNGTPRVLLSTELSRARERATLAAAAELVGLSARMLDMTTEYVQSRRQFGVAIGSFQAVKHALANCLIQIEFARPAVWRAGLSLSNGDPDAASHVSMAKALASDAARQAAKTSIQCHGAMGYTVEYDLQLFVKRAWARCADWGDAEEHIARIADWLSV